MKQNSVKVCKNVKSTQCSWHVYGLSQPTLLYLEHLSSFLLIIRILGLRNNLLLEIDVKLWGEIWADCWRPKEPSCLSSVVIVRHFTGGEHRAWWFINFQAWPFLLSLSCVLSYSCRWPVGWCWWLKSI